MWIKRFGDFQGWSIVLYAMCWVASTICSGQPPDAIEKPHHTYDKLRYRSFSEAHQIAEASLRLARQMPDSAALLQSYINFIDILYLTRKNQAARDTLTQCWSLAEQLGNPNLLAQLHNYAGGLAMRASNHNQALEHFVTALKLVEASENFRVIGSVKNNLGRLYLNMNDRKHALEVIDENLRDALSHHDTLNASNAYNIKGILYDVDKPDSSLVFYEKAISLAQQSSNDYLESIVGSNIGYLYLIDGLPDRALPYLLRAKKLSPQIGDSTSLFHIYTSLGIYHDLKENYDQAIKHFKIALDDFSQYVDIRQKNITLWEISIAYEHQGYFEQANEALNLYIDLNDSIASLDKKKEFEKIRTEFDVARKDDQILILEQNSALATNRRNTLLTSVVGLAALLILSGWFYRHRLKLEKIIRSQHARVFEMEKSQLIQDQELKKIQGAIEGKEQEQNRISQELHDGIMGKLVGIRHLLAGSLDPSDKAAHKIYMHLKSVSSELRSISHQLSVHHIKNHPLSTLLNELKAQYENSELAVELSVYPPKALENVRFESKHTLYRMLQEVFSNVARHANASTLSIAFTKHESYLSVMIEDNGVGFDPATSETGIGLANIKERVRTLQGKITINSTRNMGTAIELELPTHLLDDEPYSNSPG